METLISILTNSAQGGTVDPVRSFLCVLIAGGLGFLIALTYMHTGTVSKNFARTLVLLPMIVCLVISMVNGNLGTSVAILGAFSLVRFRSLQGSSRDICYIFFAMAIGLTCSVGYGAYAALVTIVICIVQVVLCLVRFAEAKEVGKDLRITIPENLDYTHVFDDIFEKYTKKHEIYKVKTTNMGSLYEIFYHITEIDEEKEKEFLDAIRTRNGNLTVIFGRIDKPIEEL